MPDPKEQVEENGYALIERVLDPEALTDLRSILSESIPPGKRAGTRRLLTIPKIRELAESDAILCVMQEILGGGAKPVRAILFDKQPGANWHLGYHQDRVIAVKEKVDAEAFAGWSVKEGVPHVLPPALILEQMLTIRLHLDDCTPENAPLRVSPGTHRFGILDKADVPALVRMHGEVVCICRAGDALLMRPLILHASSAAESPQHRRVIHIEFTGAELPNDLAWYE